jgi:glycosyltransferase involved in cell wall biosynthesis
MKKKILFMTSVMGSGGVEKALLTMLEYIPREMYEITLVLIDRGGAFYSLLPSDIRCVSLAVDGITNDELTKVLGLRDSVKNQLRRGHFISAFGCIYRKLIKNDYFFYLPSNIKQLKISDPVLNENYDLAICYHIHQPLNLAIVSEKINAAHKIAWVHNDFKNTNLQTAKLKRYLNKYERYFVVSKQLFNEFLEVMPVVLHKKVQIFNNIISTCLIENASKEYFPKEFIEDAGFKILSVGRLTHQKGFDIAIEVCKYLVENHYNFIWYVIGEGEEKVKLEKMIKDNHFENVLKLLGTRVNPYPYFKHCDIYVQPSRHEGYGIAVAEARVLKKPIVTTDFVGAHEQIVSGVTGLIVPFSADFIAASISMLIDSEQLRLLFNENLQKEFENKFDHVTDIDKLLKLI